jgi:predicted AlkP superfamily phosphohydrolase/phosphomutase
VKPYKIMVVGLDGATLDLIEPWTASGQLPTLGRLMNEGAFGELRSTIPPITAPAWTSFMTGKNPAKHGLYDWIYRRQDSYDVSPVTANHCAEPTLWSLLSDAGRRVCVYNVPMTYPPEVVNGIVIGGMPTPSVQAPFTYPPHLYEEISQQVDEYILYPDPGQAYSDSGVDAFLHRLYKTTENRLKVLRFLRNKEDWDFFMVVFNGTDAVQHALWKYMSPEHPQHDPAKAPKYGNAILEFYQYLDTWLAQLLEDVDEDTVLMLMSDHGAGPFRKFIHLNNWLRKQGWLKLKGGPKARTKAALFRAGFTPMKVYNLLMQLGLGALKREVVRGKGQGLLKSLFLCFDDVDWSRTVAYSLGNVGQIYLNVRGREPQGIVEPGIGYEASRNQIIRRLAELRDPETGERVIEEIYRREEVYSGRHLDRAADILFIPKNLEYFGFGEYEFGSNQIIEKVVRGISGTHRMNGMFMLKGQPIRRGVQLKGAAIIDLAPTILYLMAMPVPEDMDGRVVIEGLEPEYADLDALRVAETTSRPVSDLEVLSPEEESLIVERLRGLGYVG